MNNHPRYPSSGFPSYGHRQQNPSNVLAYGFQRLPNHDAQEFSRNERLAPYQRSFRNEVSSEFNASSSLEGRLPFSNEDPNSYSSVSRQYRLSREDMFSSGRLTQIDRRTLLQSAPRTSFLNESSNNPYFNANKLDSQTSSFPSLNKNQVTSKFKSDLYSNTSRNMFPNKDMPYDNLPLSGSQSNMQRFDQDSYQNEQIYSEAHSHFDKTLSNPVYSKNAPFTNRTFFEESQDTGFPYNKLSSGMSYLEGNSFKHEHVDNQVEEIKRELEEQKRLRENEERVEENHRLLKEQKNHNNERVPLPNSTIPTNVESVNLYSNSSSLSSQILPQQMRYKNTMDMEEQSEIPNKREMFYSESSQSSENAFYGDFSLYTAPSANKIIDHSNILNYKESWNNSLESQNRCLFPEKMAVVQDSSQELSSVFTERRSNEIIAATTIDGKMPITSVNNAATVKIDDKINLDEKLATKEKISETSQNCSNKHLFPIVQLSENCNIGTNVALGGESLNNNSLDKNLELSASFLTIPPENLPLKDWTGLKSSKVHLTKSIEPKNYSPVFDKPFPANELQNSASLHFEKSSSEHDETSRHSMLSDNKVTSTDWSASVPISLEDNLNKCLEIMKNYSPILIKNDGLKSESLSVQGNSNECLETTKKISPNSGGNISSNESSNSAPIPFLNEASDSQSLANISVNSTEDLSQESESSNVPSFNSVITSSREVTGSALEDALVTLHISSPIVGLDYIVEEKNRLSVDGRFPFKCKLCNSSIARTLILDHIQGSKHRLRYLKIKDEATYEKIMHQKDQHDKDILIFKAAAEMEHKYGRGRVVVLFDTPVKVVKKIPVMKVSHDLTDVDFESIHKPDFKILEVDNEKHKPEKQVPSNLPEPVINVEDDLYVNPTVSSFSTSLPKQNFDYEKKGLEIAPCGTLENVRNSKEITEVVEFDKQSDIKSEFPAPIQQQNNQVSSLPLKRSFPLDDEYKNIKKPHVESLNMNYNPSTDFPSQSNPESPSSKDIPTTESDESNMFNPLILEQLSKCEISSEDEAKIVLQTVDVLLKLLLRFKLKDKSDIDLENLMLSHHKSPEEISKILGCLEGNVCEDSSINEDIPKVLSKSECNTQSQISNELKLVSDDLAIKRNQTGNQNLSQNNLVTNTQALGSSKQVIETSESRLTTPVINTCLPSNSHLLQPPPFFCWPTSSNVATTINQSSVAVAQTAQSNMTWSTAYQPHMAYYQQHGFNISHMYQPYAIPMIPSIPSASVPLTAQIPSVAPPTMMAPLPPNSVDISLPPPPPPPPPPSEPPPLPK